MIDDSRRAHALAVVTRLRAEGFEALWAGGCVRDLLLGIEPSDFDVATDARPEQVMKLFRRTCAVGASFGVVRVLGSAATGDVEVATFRSDGAYIDGRRPETIEFSTAELDASRRDFTINGMFFDPVASRVIDYVGGRADLDAKILRAIGDPVARFTEDKLRLLRAVRFAARLDFAIDPNTRRALVEMAGEVTTVAAERIAQELRKMLVDRSRVAAVQLASETGLVAAILPEIRPIEVDAALWSHTMGVLQELPASSTFTLALAALLHDAGKPSARTIVDGKPSFPDYALFSMAIANQTCHALKLANSERERILWLIQEQRSLIEPKRLRESTLKRILATDGVDELLALHRADAISATGNTDHVDYCAWYLREQPDGPINPPPLVSGHDLVRIGLRPDKSFAVILYKLRDAQLDRTITSKEEALDLVERIRAEMPEHG